MSPRTYRCARRRPSAARVAALLLLAELLAFVHAGCAEHRFCHEHGVVEDVHPRAKTPLAHTAHHPGAHDSREEPQAATDEDTGEEHDACVVLAKRVETGATSDPSIAAATPDRSDTRLEHATDRVPARARRYLLAPKQSPPAA